MLCITNTKSYKLALIKRVPALIGDAEAMNGRGVPGSPYRAPARKPDRSARFHRGCKEQRGVPTKRILIKITIKINTNTNKPSQ